MAAKTQKTLDNNSAPPRLLARDNAPRPMSLRRPSNAVPHHQVRTTYLIYPSRTKSSQARAAKQTHSYTGPALYSLDPRHPPILLLRLRISTSSISRSAHSAMGNICGKPKLAAPDPSAQHDRPSIPSTAPPRNTRPTSSVPKKVGGPPRTLGSSSAAPPQSPEDARRKAAEAAEVGS
jgi:hypothetical protein